MYSRAGKSEMPEDAIVCRMKPYIQPFERVLALGELRQLTGRVPTAYESDGGNNFRVLSSATTAGELSERLAYWESVTGAQQAWTRQTRREATTSLSRSAMTLDELSVSLPFSSTIPVPNRRCLRYGPHDIHEYRGKFFPSS